MKEAGFENGQPVKVTVERGQLIIRLAEESLGWQIKISRHGVGIFCFKTGFLPAIR
ncbi:SymE family type I addiction module toxin [Pantoea agglomerans]|uniref:SymE family type I addiction module toxin n=1 Tax=Enterobacter agglomerans TaxID=549 RepID=UPI003DA178DB